MNDTAQQPEKPVVETHIPPNSVQALMKLTQEGNETFPVVMEMSVTDQGTLDAMVLHAGTINAWIKGVDSYFDPIERAIGESLRVARQQHAEALKPGLLAKQHTQKELSAFTVKQEEAKRERERLERVATEQKTQKSVERTIGKLEKVGATESEIAAVLHQPAAPVVRAAPEIEKPKGFVTQKRYSATMDSNGMASKIFRTSTSTAERDFVVGLLVAFGLKGKQIQEKAHLLKYLSANESALNAEARSSKEQFAVPGATLVTEQTSHVRG